MKMKEILYFIIILICIDASKSAYIDLTGKFCFDTSEMSDEIMDTWQKMNEMKYRDKRQSLDDLIKQITEDFIKAKKQNEIRRQQLINKLLLRKITFRE